MHGIAEDAECGGLKGEENEQGGDCEKQGDGDFRIFAIGGTVGKRTPFINIGDGCRDEENRDVDPVRRFSDRTVIGVEDNGYGGEPEQNTFELDAPKVRAVAKEKALQDAKEEHRPKEQLHMLPSRFVYTRKRRNPPSLFRPII